MKLPQISGKELIKKLMQFGFVVTRQKGSHIRIEKNTKNKTIKITVPNHKEIKRGTLNQIIKASEISKEELFP
ncbi:MAG: type II toxin-antitoxin system HicA family toxin [Nanoarchaeota archaeon]|nr:type II toxin-antitoxin system HicA family toxin [Nanoarchaeota archaeon]